MTTLLATTTITTAVGATATTPVQFRRSKPGPRNLTIEAIFVYGSGGTTADVYVQTTLDGGATWIDIANLHFTTASLKSVVNLSSLTPVTTPVTPTDGSLASNTCKDGILGSQIRVKWVTTGTYAGGTTLQVVCSDGLTS